MGLSQEVIDEYFTGTTSRVGGVSLEEIAEEVAIRHRVAYPNQWSASPHRNLLLSFGMTKLGQKMLGQGMRAFRAMRPASGNPGAFFPGMGAVAADAVKMEAENKLMELTPMVVQEGVGALTNKASGVDWEGWKARHWHDDLFLFGRNGRVLVLAQDFLNLLLDLQQGGIQRGGLCGNFGEVGNMGGAAVR